MDSRPCQDSRPCLGGLTALEYWRQIRFRVAAANAPSEYDVREVPLLVRLLFGDASELDYSAMPKGAPITSVPRTLSSALAAEAVSACAGLALPLSCYVSSGEGRRYYAGIRTVTLGGGFPPGSFVSDPRGFIAPAPELLALLLARDLTPGRYLMVASELCGFYSLGAAGTQAFASPQLTAGEMVTSCSRDLMASRQDAAQRMPRGTRHALRLLPHAVERAASPAEAALALLLSLPSEMGGFGLPAPALNQAIVVGGSEYVCDLSWNNGSCLLEYQGATHKQRWRRVADRRKGNWLRADGRVLLEAGREELMSLEGMNQLAEALARALGVSLPPATRELLQRRIDLRAEVLECFSPRGRARHTPSSQ